MWKPDWRTILSAFLIVAAFPPWGYSALIWIALIPWFYALNRAPHRRAAFFQGLWLCFFMTLGGFYWVAFVLKEFGNLPWSVAILGWLLFALFCQPQFFIFAPFYHYFSKDRFSEREFQNKTVARSLLIGLCLGLLYCGIDWILPKLWVDTLGHSLYSARYLRQAADIGGATLLTFVIYIVNDVVFVLLEKTRNRDEPSYWPSIRFSMPGIILASALVSGLFLYGSARSDYVDQKIASAKKVPFGVIQGNIGDFDKLAAEKGARGAANKVLDTFFELSEKALSTQPRPEFLIWPETSYPTTFRTPQSGDELSRDLSVERFVRTHKITLLFGGYDHQNGLDYNSFFYLSPQGDAGVSGKSDLQTYHKNILLLFGEYIPGAAKFKFIRDQFPQVGNFGQGAGPVVINLERPTGEKIATGPIICYEALFSNYVIAAANLGSQVITNITNDSWFGSWGEPQLHLSLTSFRSIETRLPQLRSTNTGISTLITANGDITVPTQIGEPAVLTVQVPITPPIWTLMKAWGDWFGIFAISVGSMGLGAGWMTSRRRS